MATSQRPPQGSALSRASGGAFQQLCEGRIGAADRHDVHPPPAVSPAPDTSRPSPITEASHRGIATAIMPGPQRGRSDGSTPRPQAEPEGREGAQTRSGVEAAGRPRSHYVAAERASAALLGSLRPAALAWVRAGPGAALGGCSPTNGELRHCPQSRISDPPPRRSRGGPGGAWRIGWVGAARPTGICALVHNLVGDTSLDRLGRSPPIGPPGCRAEPDRKGRVGVAHATRKCALVHNISQAWGAGLARLVDLQGLGNTQRQGRIRGLSLGRT